MTNTPLLTATQDNLRLSIYPCEYAESPRSWDNLGTFVTFERRYCSPDSHAYRDEREFKEALAAPYTDKCVGGLADNELHEILEANYGVLPVFRYEHSGIAYNTTGFTCGWDSGQVGFIYVAYADIAKEWGTITAEERVAKAKEVLKNEVHLYSQWVNGEVYSFVAETNKKCLCCERDNWQEVDGGGGYFGTDWKTNGLYDGVPATHRHLVDILTHQTTVGV